MRRCQCNKYQKRAEGRLVRLKSKDERYLLKCLDCNGRWWSRAKYAGRLKRWTERSRKGMTDADILARLSDGSLVVDVDAATVRTVGTQQNKQLKVIQREGPGGSTYRFVTICRGGRKKKIALHRLVWIAAHGRLVPEGHDIHHVNGPKAGDQIGNLALLTTHENRSLAGRSRGQADLDF